MTKRNIRLHRHPSPRRKPRAKLLFVHGGYVDSSCWQQYFIPFFQGHGYDCFAVDLSGHGASEGRERIDEFGIDDYAADVAHALEQIGEPAIVVGHSMGTLVLERYLEAGEALSAAFISPVPTSGTLPSALRLAARFPTFLQAIDAALQGVRSAAVAEVLTRVYFAEDMPGAEAMHFMDIVVPESQKAIAEMATVALFRPKVRRKLPVLVMGGEEDAVFPSSMLHFSAVPWQAEVRRIPRVGHVLMLDKQWQTAADGLLEWITRVDGHASGEPCIN